MSEPFHERFGLVVDVSEARRRFINRVNNKIFSDLFWSAAEHYRKKAKQEIANRLGEKYVDNAGFEVYTKGDFVRTLLAIEVLHDELSLPVKVSKAVVSILGLSELDLGIRWEDGRFHRAGAELLDRELVRQPLQWLSGPTYQAVRDPMEKGLRHFLESLNRPELLNDVVTDMYEAVEALAKIVTGRDDDLSKNREGFISRIKAADEYKPLLKAYVEYANKLARHAAPPGSPRPLLSQAEVESFVYLTGVFVRLAIQAGSLAK